MKYISSILIGVAVFFVSTFVAMSLGNYFSGGNASNTYFSGIAFAIIFLTGVVATCTTLILLALNDIKEEITSKDKVDKGC